MGDHFRRALAWYVLGGVALCLAGIAWVVVEVRALRVETGTILRNSDTLGR